MFFVVTSGAFVRLTASGLGCDHWPRCGDGPVPDGGQPTRDHRVQQPPRGCGRDRASRSRPGWPPGRSRALPLARTVGARRAPRGARPDPARRPHDPAPSPPARSDVPLPARPDRPRALRPRRRRGVEQRVGAGATGRPGLVPVRRPLGGLPLAAALVATGAVATASGPHPGSQKGVERLGLADHRHRLRARAGRGRFGIGFLVLGFIGCSARDAYPGSSGSGSVRSSCSWRSRSWARCSTATLSPGGSCSSTSSSPRRSGALRSRSRPPSGAHRSARRGRHGADALQSAPLGQAVRE